MDSEAGFDSLPGRLRTDLQDMPEYLHFGSQESLVRGLVRLSVYRRCTGGVSYGSVCLAARARGCKFPHWKHRWYKMAFFHFVHYPRIHSGPLFASIAQLAERAAVNRGVTGSSPVWSAWSS